LRVCLWAIEKTKHIISEMLKFLQVTCMWLISLQRRWFGQFWWSKQWRVVWNVLRERWRKNLWWSLFSNVLKGRLVVKNENLLSASMLVFRAAFLSFIYALHW